MAELHVSKKSIYDLFTAMQKRKFIIPEYQREYSWDIEKCETLWSDIELFSRTEALQSGVDYFLGTIVSFLNEDKNLEVIDGQQRLTSFILLLRAFYKKLEESNVEDQDVIGLKNQLAPCIWDISDISQQIEDPAKFHIQSEVVTEEDREIFYQIIKTGKADEKAKDKYSINYLFFQDKCNNYASSNPIQWKNLCIIILRRCIILPIECDTQETALTIFSTLNDRGMPLEDSDIFKAQIYKNQITEQQKKEFSEQWKDLTEICKNSNLRINDIFRYYSHVIRARNMDKTKEVALRKFYAKDQYKLLKDKNLMKEILRLAEFWQDINTNHVDNCQSIFISLEARQYLHCLDSYTNEYWKYPVSVFFLQHQNDPEKFSQHFVPFLKQLTALVLAKAVDEYGINYIKDHIYESYISLDKGHGIEHMFSFDVQGFRESFGRYSESKLAKSFLLLYAYLHQNQNTLIQRNIDIEHIFPKKWQTANYNGWSHDQAQEYLEKFGNKTVLEKKRNIQAGNNYFQRKKEHYLQSDIQSVKEELGNYAKDDWLKEDIEAREERMIETLIQFFSQHLPTKEAKK